MAANRVIGHRGQLPWHLPEDLAFFKQLTLGHPILMGRKTWDSIGRPLPRRRNLVLSRRWPDSPPLGTEWLTDPDELATLQLTGPIFVIGGAEIFRLLLPRCTSVYVTHVHASPEGDTWMPPFEDSFPYVRTLKEHPQFTIKHYQRVPHQAT